MKTLHAGILASVIGLTLALPISHAADAPKPNIIYFLIDDLGYGDTGFNGCKDIHTPHLDALAKSGAVLESYYVQPLCTPTRGAFLTGRYPIHMRAKSPDFFENPTLPQALKEAGYETAIFGKWHLGESSAYRPTKNGFEHQYGFWGGKVDYFKHLNHGILDWHRDDKPAFKEAGYSTHLIAKEACRVIHDAPTNKPLFLYVAFNGVHSPLQVPKEYLAPYKDIQKPDRHTYAGMVAAVDEAIGTIMAAATKKGIANNTLFIASSDNGGVHVPKRCSNAPLRGEKRDVYEGGIRVSACASWAGHIPPGQIIKEPLHVVDWYPTLVTLAGGTVKPKLAQELDGLDISKVLTEGAKAPRDFLFLPGLHNNQFAIRQGDWKLSRNPAGANGAIAASKVTKSPPVFELYNLANDIGEKNNVAKANPAIFQELSKTMAEIMKTAKPSASAEEGEEE